MPDKRMTPKMRHRQTKQSRHITRMEILDKIYKESLELNDAGTFLAPSKFLDRHGYLFSLVQQLRNSEKDINPGLCIRDSKAWKRFFQWIDKCKLSKEGEVSPSIENTQSDLISSCVDIIDHKEDNRGYGLITKRDVPRNQSICQLPLSCMLTTETATHDRNLAKFVQDDPILNDMPNVVLVMHLLNEYCKGDDSPWFPYLAILPKSYSTIFYLSLEQIQHLRVSNHMYDVVKMIRAITRQYAYFYSKLQATDLPLKGKLTYDFYCWGVSTVCTRQQELPATDRRRYPTMNALIPILDMCNHKEGSLPPMYDEENHTLRINTSVDLKSGDEIFIFYGYRSSGNFFIHNGFVPNRVEKDFLPIILGMNKHEDLFKKRMGICELLKLTPSDRFRLNNHHERMDIHLVRFLVVLLMNKQELDWILDHQNPAGLMDDIVDYIVEGHKLDNKSGVVEEPGVTAITNKIDKFVIGRRLKIAISNYLSQRAMIYEKVIDKALKDIEGNDQITQNIISLLNHEKGILSGYCSHL